LYITIIVVFLTAFLRVLVYLVTLTIQNVRFQADLPNKITRDTQGERHNPSGRIMTLGATQHLTELNTTNISWWLRAAGA